MSAPLLAASSRSCAVPVAAAKKSNFGRLALTPRVRAQTGTLVRDLAAAGQYSAGEVLFLWELRCHAASGLACSRAVQRYPPTSQARRHPALVAGTWAPAFKFCGFRIVSTPESIFPVTQAHANGVSTKLVSSPCDLCTRVQIVPHPPLVLGVYIGCESETIFLTTPLGPGGNISGGDAPTAVPC